MFLILAIVYFVFCLGKNNKKTNPHHHYQLSIINYPLSIINYQLIKWLHRKMAFPKKNITTVLCIKKKVYFCKLFEVECKGGWKSWVRTA